jgi:guanyl-specific ribonuclease Sa
MIGRAFPWLRVLLAIALVVGWQHWKAPTPASTNPATSSAPERTDNAPATTGALPSYLPPEAHTTITLIQRGGPFPHRQDGSTFGNFERQLPPQPRGWYREYTVDTPGLNHRGARRIVTGGNPPREWFYTEDHYRSFRAFDVKGPAP